jgi:hypothetical protein
MQNSTPEPQEGTGTSPTSPKEAALKGFCLCIDCEELKVVLIPSTSLSWRFIELSRQDAESWLEAKLLFGIPLSQRDWVRLAQAEEGPPPKWGW